MVKRSGFRIYKLNIVIDVEVILGCFAAVDKKCDSKCSSHSDKGSNLRNMSLSL